MELIRHIGDSTNQFQIQFFLFLVILDILTGFIKGFATQKANSTKGLIGILKHLLVVVVNLIVYPFLNLLGEDIVATSFISFFIASYGISVVENWGQIGLPMPKFVKKYFEKLHREQEGEDINDPRGDY